MMIDNNHLPPSVINIRTLLYYLGQALDERLTMFRKGTAYETVRSSDVRVFMRALSCPQTISDIARALNITRQAVQSSVQRLQKIQVLDLAAMPGNKRDKLVVITPRGQHARNTASQQITRFEAEIAAVIGEDGLVALRENLEAVLKSTIAHNKTDAERLTQLA
jgi:DNA-binding MarR family transcriptional regulator